MRTAVVRVDVDPTGVLTPEQLATGMAALHDVAGQAGAGVIDSNVTAMPVGRRQVRLLIAGVGAEEVTSTGVRLCTQAFGTTPAAGVITYVSRGTDDDVRGVLAGFGLTGEIRRTPGDGGEEVVEVTLPDADLARVGESRIHTALEASLNSEVHIHTS
jgi:hypothetical protein